MSKKIIALTIALVLALSVVVINTVSVGAAAPKIIKELDGSAGGIHDKDGSSKDEAAKTITAPEAYNDHIYSYNANKADNGVVGGNLYKIAFCITINSIDNTKLENSLRINPGFSDNNIYGNHNVGQLWADVPFELLKDYVGQKVMVVGVFSTGANITNIEGRLWKTEGISVTVHKVMIAENGYDFSNNATYPLVAEVTDNDRDFAAAAKVQYSTGMSVPDSIKDKSGLKATIYKLKDGADLGPALSETKGGGADYVIDDTVGNFESYSKEKVFGADGVMEVVDGFNNVTVVPNLQYGGGEGIVEKNAMILTGYVVPKESGEYKIIGKDMDNCVAMYINDKLVFEFWQDGVWEDKGDREIEGSTITLEKDKAYKFTFYFVEDNGGECWNFATSIGGAESIGFNDAFSYYTVDPVTGEEPEQPPTPNPADPSKPSKPATGDVTVVAALLAAGATGFAGFKLRKKSK